MSFPQQNWTNIVRSVAHFAHNVSVWCLCSLKNFGSVSFLSDNKENQLFLQNPWLFEFWSEHSFLLFRWRRRHNAVNGRTVVLCNQTTCNQTPTVTRYSAHKSSSVVVNVPTRYRTEKDCTELKTGSETKLLTKEWVSCTVDRISSCSTARTLARFCSFT